MLMTSFQILGLGTALPQHSVSQKAAVMFAQTVVSPESCDSNNLPGLIQVLYRRGGIQSRLQCVAGAHHLRKKPLLSGSIGQLEVRKIEGQAPQNECSVMNAKLLN